MTADAAIYNYFSSFGIKAYQYTEVPDDVTYPFLTYTSAQTDFNSTSGASITVNLWYYTDSEAVPNAKVEEIRASLKNGGVQLSCDDGTVWLVMGSPFCQSVYDDADKNIKRRYINLTRFDNRI